MTIQLTDHQKKYINPLALKWIEALKSGEYKQTQGRLANMDKTSFCCLGVAAEVCQWDYSPVDSSLAHLPYESIGLLSPSGYPKNLPDVKALYSLNDRYDWEFDKIAEHLLAHPEEYFIEISPELALQG